MRFSRYAPHFALAQANILENSATGACNTPAGPSVEGDGCKTTTCERNNRGRAATVGVLPSEQSCEAVVGGINDGGVARLFDIFCETGS